MTIMTMTVGESRELAQLERVIRAGLEQFLAVGRALAAIRDRRLYRETHETFETYCRERWKFSKTHANRLISGAAATDRLGDIEVQPTAESQVRPLTGLPPDQAAKAWTRAVEVSGGRPTADDVRNAVREAVGKTKEQTRQTTRSVVFADRVRLFAELARWGRAEKIPAAMLEKFSDFLKSQFR